VRNGVESGFMALANESGSLTQNLPQALMATMKLQDMKVPVASQVDGPE